MQSLPVTFQLIGEPQSLPHCCESPMNTTVARFPGADARDDESS